MAALLAGYQVDLRTASMYVDSERNAVVADFLDRNDHEWLIWLDADMSLDVATLELLCADPAHPVVSGIYGSTLAGGFRTVTYVIDGDRHVPLTHDELYARERIDGLIPVDSVGAGCLALHRSVLEQLRDTASSVREGIHPWFIESTWRGRVLGEDHGLCDRLRRLGVPILVHPGVRASHYKTIEITVPQEPTHAAVE